MIVGGIVLRTIGMTSVALTYDQLAKRLGIATDSARRLVNRKKWSRTRGNDQRAVIQVPAEFLARYEDGPGDDRQDGPQDRQGDCPEDNAPVVLTTRGDQSALNAVAALIVELRDQLSDLQAERVIALEAENRLLKQVNEDLKQEREDLKADRDTWREQAQHLALSVPPRRSWWPWRRTA